MTFTSSSTLSALKRQIVDVANRKLDKLLRLNEVKMYTSVCVCAFVSVCMCIYASVCICVHVSVYLCACVYMCVFVRIFNLLS